MTQCLTNVSFARLARWSATLAAAAFSVALMGGIRHQPAQKVALPAAPAITVEQVSPKTVAQPESILSQSASVELLHDAPAQAEAPKDEAVQASARISGRAKHVPTIWMQVTAYCPCTRCCGPGARGLTASGRTIRYNHGKFVAADTRLLPFGTKLIIPGYAGEQPVEVIDRGGAIKGHHIDLFFPTHQQAKEWGVRWMQVTLAD